jgi:hypothetical protein
MEKVALAIGNLVGAGAGVSRRSSPWTPNSTSQPSPIPLFPDASDFLAAPGLVIQFSHAARGLLNGVRAGL